MASDSQAYTKCLSVQPVKINMTFLHVKRAAVEPAHANPHFCTYAELAVLTLRISRKIKIFDVP